MVLRGALQSFGLCFLLAVPGLGRADTASPSHNSAIDAGQGAELAHGEALAAQISSLSALLQVPALLDVMRQEGISYGSSLESDMFPGEGGGPWAASVAMIYDVGRTGAKFDQAFAEALKGDPQAVAAGMDFFGSDLGQRIVGLEVSTRRAMLDPTVEAAADNAYAAMTRSASPRLAALERFAKANDLIESNVMGALNANLAFYQGLSEGGGLEDGMTAQDMIAQVWEQEAEVRSETNDWLYPFMAMSYEPLTDAEFADYIAFSETPAGRKLNAALFKAFEVVYSDVSKNLGLVVARQLQGEDI